MQPGPDGFPGLTESDWDRLNAYADGELSDAELSRFEAEAATRPELKAAAAAVASVHATLGTIYGPSVHSAGDTDDVRAVTGGASNIAGRLRPGPMRFVTRVAAAVLLIGSALVLRSYLTDFATVEPTPIATDVARLYARYASAMEPTVVCDTAPKFARYTREAFGRTIAADFDAASDAGVVLVGWVYPDDLYTGDDHEISGRRVLLGYGPGASPVVTVFQDASWPAPASHDGLLVKSALFGDVAVYEIGPAGEPQILPLLAR